MSTRRDVADIVAPALEAYSAAAEKRADKAYDLHASRLLAAEPR